ncbi:fasciclin domain-containing protein [Luteolibacter marinus]|uniref:fasciclin domain-containing protein n=1 Tax=Luteolibacter marinus TaxID=2776705 RepID=UPI00186605A6|nr:fasciclin domain-containing protein [Luteolibacter marinus]
MKRTIPSLLLVASTLTPALAQEAAPQAPAPAVEVETRSVEVQADENGEVVRKVEVQRTVIPAEPPRPVVPVDKTIAARVATSDAYSKFQTALEASGLDKTLNGPGPYTVFAPTDTAFEKLADQSFDDLLKPGNRTLLINLLQRHIIPQLIRGEDFKTGEYLTNAGELIHVKVESDKITIGEVNVTMSNDLSANGVMHAIDGLIAEPAQLPR